MTLCRELIMAGLIMGLQLIICFLSMSAGTMIGYYLYKREYQREKYFEGLINLCNSLTVDIRFSQRTMACLIESYMQERNSPLNLNLTEYLAYIKGQSKALVISRGYLRVLELEDVLSFLNSLGRSDSPTQVFEIENYKNKFALYRERQSKILEKQAKNYIKLGFLFGLALGILLI